MLMLSDVFEKNDIAPAHARLVRHGNKEIPVLATFRNDRKRFDAYQAFQEPNRFGDSKHIAVFAPLEGNAALFIGLWDVIGCRPNRELTQAHRALIDEYGFPQFWKDIAVWYDLRLSEAMADLSERLVIDWGRAALSWVQRGTNPKLLLEIRRPNSIGDFVSYSAVKLSHHELRKLMTDSSSNLTWKNALASVNGVYLIRDASTGKLYVGSAYGAEGIYGRWRVYATTGHGGDVMLKDLDHSHFEFSILEIAPLTLSAQEVIDIENKWKDRLGTRLFGHLNSMEGG